MPRNPKSKISNPKSKRPPPAKKKPRLNRYAAAKAIAKGAKPVNVAKAAGSKARTRKKLHDVGARLIQELRSKGEIALAFNQAGYDVHRFAREVVEQTQATKRTRVHYEGALAAEYEDIDWQSRHAAREQFARAVGIVDLPLTVGGGGGLLLESVSETLLVRIASGEVSDEELSQFAHSIVPTGVASTSGAAGSPPAQ